MIDFKNDGKVAAITLDRPDKRNALNFELLQQLKQALKQSAESRVLVLRGAGKIFCAGLDLTETHSEIGVLLADVFKLLYQLPTVTIAAVQGAAIAGGAGLMAACDVVYATEQTIFGFPEARRGLVPAQILTFLTRQIPQRKLREWLLLGNMFSAEEAQQYGLINYITNDLNKAVETAVASALEGAPNALKETKQLIDTMYPTKFEDDLEKGFQIFRKMLSSNEAHEGMNAFVEQRKPKWNQT